MESPCYLTIPQSGFLDKIRTCISEGNKLVEWKIITEPHLEEFTAAMDNWASVCVSLLKDSFSLSKNEYLLDFKNSDSNNFKIAGSKYSATQLGEFKKNNLHHKIKSLRETEKLIPISDSVIRIPEADLHARSKYSVAEIINLLVDKLYLLYDDSYYSINRILEGNGITLKRTGDNLDLANILTEQNLAETLGGSYGSDLYIRLTLKGVKYVEERNKQYFENYDEINKSGDGLANKIDEILDHLKKQGLDNEKIHEELEELKLLYKTVGKKTFGQVVKGKLIDLALAKLIENDTMNYIYHTLTSHVFRLPWP